MARAMSSDTAPRNVRLRKPQRAAVLRVLDSRAERAADERCEDDSAPTVPLLRQGIGKRQPQREEEKHIHQHRAVELRLLPRSGKRGEGREDEFVVAGCAIQNIHFAEQRLLEA